MSLKAFHFDANLTPFSSILGCLGGHWRFLGGVLGPLGGVLGASRSLLRPPGGILVPLKPSWRYLGASSRPKIHATRLHPLAVAGTQQPLLRIPFDSFWILLCISLVYTIKKEVK